MLSFLNYLTPAVLSLLLATPYASATPYIQRRATVCNGHAEVGIITTFLVSIY